MSITRKWSQSPVAWAAALALILPFAFGTVHTAETEKPVKPATSAETPVPPPTLDSNGDAVSLRSAWAQWQNDGRAFWQQMDALVETLDGLIAEDIERV